MRKSKSETQAQRLQQAIRHRQDQEKQELRQLILREAGKLFLELGYERFSLRKVAERIGYSPTTIYLYFRDKDDLLFTVVDEGFKLFAQQLTAVAADTQDSWQRIIALGRAYIAFGVEHPMHYQLMFMQRTDFLTDRQEGENQPRLASLLILRQAVQQALDAGVLRPGDVKIYSDVLWSHVHGIVSLAISMPDLFDASHVQSLMEAAWQMQWEGLRQP